MSARQRREAQANRISARPNCRPIALPASGRVRPMSSSACWNPAMSKRRSAQPVEVGDDTLMANAGRAVVPDAFTHVCPSSAWSGSSVASSRARWGNATRSRRRGCRPPPAPCKRWRGAVFCPAFRLSGPERRQSPWERTHRARRRSDPAVRRPDSMALMMLQIPSAPVPVTPHQRGHSCCAAARVSSGYGRDSSEQILPPGGIRGDHPAPGISSDCVRSPGRWVLRQASRPVAAIARTKGRMRIVNRSLL